MSRERADWEQQWEMRLSEERDAHVRTRRLQQQSNNDALKWWRTSNRDQADAREARKIAVEAARQVTLAEQETRRVSFQNLALQRKLSKYADAVPSAEHECLRVRLESAIAEQADTIAALRAQLASQDAECEDEAEHEWKEGDWKGVEGGGVGSRRGGGRRGGGKGGGGNIKGGGGKRGGAKGGEQSRAERELERLRISVGVEPRRNAPARTFKGSADSESAERNWAWRSSHHLTAVMRGRPVSHIAIALRRLGRLKEFADCADFASQVRRVVQGALAAVSERWSARLSVHIWDRLELSRNRMDDLRHLLSFVYKPLTDKYEQIMVWQNPHDENDQLEMPCLVGRAGREKLFGKMAEEGEISVGENGRCERDACKCAAQLYSRFSRAMRSDFSPARPARPIFIFDGTGGSLGKGICHAELGSADFTGECKQSRATLNPLAMYSGNDHALPLRENLTLTARTFNDLIAAGEMKLDDGRRVPCEPIVVGDMQGVKCVMGMTESCHSVWCKCRARGQVDGEGPQHDYGEPGERFESYEKMIEFFDQIGCEFKEEEFLLANAHLSKGLFYGGQFTSFTCPDCGYKPTAAQGKADLAKFNALTDVERKEARKKHVEGGAHWHVELMMGPLVRERVGGFGMRRCGVDTLHLVYLNMFKHAFKYTIHEPLPDSKRAVVSHYLKAAGFYSYDAADESDDPVKRWIGREVKRFLHEADIHLPFLLSLSSGQIDVCEETAAATNAAGEEEMDVSDDEFEPTEEEIAAEAARAPLIALNADRWDRFLSWTREIEQPWEADTDKYRKERALQWCNGARAVSRDLYDLKPTMHSWVPHIACNIVPRQIVSLGEPTRRSADACESYGACAKRLIKHVTCRRALSATYTRGFVEQAFRRLVVRSGLIHGEANAPFLQRKDAMLLDAGRASDGHSRAEGPTILIRVKVEQELERA